MAAAFEAQIVQTGEMIDWTADANYSAGAVVQLRDGRAGVVSTEVTSGNKVGVYIGGLFKVAKPDTMTYLPSTRIYWDHSANTSSLLHGNDRDFYLGSVQEDAASKADVAVIALNLKPGGVTLADGFVSVPVTTAGHDAACYGVGDGCNIQLSTTAEVQKFDALSLRGFAPGAESIVSAEVCINVNGDNAAYDFNIGVASATHASDFDSIGEHLSLHVDGNSTKLNVQSKDSGTTVAAADSGVTFTAGTPFVVQFDLRNLSDIHAYINGVRVLDDKAFKLNAAVGPMKLIAHVEKTSDDSPGNVSVISLQAAPAQV